MTVKYDSAFEKRLDTHVFKGTKAKYHPEPIKFTFKREMAYEADWSLTDKSGKTILIEGKGIFRTRLEVYKYLSLKENLDPNKYELVFIFQNDKARMLEARERADGTYLTMGEWATKAGFRWFTPITIKEIL